MQKITLYIAEHKNGRNKWQTTYSPYHEDKEAAEKDAEASAYGREHRVRTVKAVKLEIGDKVEGREQTGRFGDARDEYEATGSRAFSGDVREADKSPVCCGLRITTIKLSHPYIINGKGAGLVNVKIYGAR